MQRTSLLLLLVLSACAGAPPAPTPPPPAAPIASASPVSSPDAGSFDAGAAPLPRTGMDAYYAFDARVTEAFNALSTNGLTPDVIEKFRALKTSPPSTKVRTNVLVASLEGALSDDGSALVVRILGTGKMYLADPKTGVLRQRKSASWPDGPTFLAGTQLIPMFEDRFAPTATTTTTTTSGAGSKAKRARELVLFDAKTQKPELEVAFEGQATCGASGGTLMAWPSRADRKVHVWDAKTKSEIDTFDLTGMADGEGCVSVLNATFVSAASTPSPTAAPREFVLRNVQKKQSIATVSGGAYGPTVRLSPDGKLLAIGQRPSQRDNNKFPGKTVLVDTATGKTVATSSDCPSVGALTFNAKGTILAAADQRDVCIFSVSSSASAAGTTALKLVKKTAPIRDPFATGAVTQVIREMRFFAKEQALLVATEDSSTALIKVATGEVLWKGTRGGFMIEPAPAPIAHFLINKSDESTGPFVHATVTEDLKVKEEPAQEAEMKQLYERRWQQEKTPALRDALARVASASCELNGVLVPKEACAP